MRGARRGQARLNALLAVLLALLGAATARRVDHRSVKISADRSSQQAGRRDRPLGGQAARSLLSDPMSGVSCRKMAPLECGFLYSELDTVLAPQGLLELSGFQGSCQDSCVTYLLEAPECQAAPGFQQLMLDACKAYQCAGRVASACGPSLEGQLLAHPLACSAACTTAVQSPECDGAAGVLPGFYLFQEQIGGTGQECSNYRCQQQLGQSCPTFDSASNNLLSSDMCTDLCYSALRGDDCLNAGIVIVSVQGDPTALWDPTTASSPDWGPASPGCSGPQRFSTQISAEFPEQNVLELLDQPGLTERFQASFSSAVTVALQILGLDAESLAVEVLQISGAEAGGVGLLADIVFRSEEDQARLLDNADSFRFYASLAFQTEGLQGEVTSIEGAPALEAQQDSSAAQPRPPQPEVTTMQSSQGDDSGLSWLVLALSAGICVAAAALLALMVVIAVTKRRDPAAGDGPEPEPPLPAAAAAAEQQPVAELDGFWLDARGCPSGPSSRRLSSAMGNLTLTTGTSAMSVDSSLATMSPASVNQPSPGPCRLPAQPGEDEDEEEVWATPPSAFTEPSCHYDSPASASWTPTSLPVPTAAMSPEDGDLFWLAPPLGLSEPGPGPRWALARTQDSRQVEELPSARQRE